VDAKDRHHAFIAVHQRSRDEMEQTRAPKPAHNGLTPRLAPSFRARHFRQRAAKTSTTITTRAV
jgi:hypothetical protein